MQYAIGTKLGFDLAIGCVDAVSTTVSGISSLINKLSGGNYRHQITELTDMLATLDLDNKIETIHTIVASLRKQKISAALKKCITSLNSCLTEIHTELAIICEKRNDNDKIYFFRSLRSWTFEDHISKLIRLDNALDKRIKLFFDVLRTNEQFMTEESILLQQSVVVTHL